MPAIGITGGIATGKSALCESLRHMFPTANFFIADIPLLYETGGESLCDLVVVVACSYKVQLARLAERISLKNTEAEQMIKSQMPLEEKIARADHVVWNDGSRAVLMEQAHFLAALWQQESWATK